MSHQDRCETQGQDWEQKFPACGHSLSPSFSTGEYGCSFSNPQYRLFQSSCEPLRSLRVMFLYSCENSESKQDRPKNLTPCQFFEWHPLGPCTVSSNSLPTRQNHFLSARNFYSTFIKLISCKADSLHEYLAVLMWGSLF